MSGRSDPLDLAYTVAAHVHTVTEANRTVLVDCQSGLYLGLNRLGTRVWMAVSARRPLGWLVKDLAREAAVGEEMVRDDVRTFLTALLDRNLVVVGVTDAEAMSDEGSRTG